MNNRVGVVCWLEQFQFRAAERSVLPAPGSLSLSILLEGAERKALEGDQLSWGADPRNRPTGTPAKGGTGNLQTNEEGISLK